MASANNFLTHPAPPPASARGRFGYFPFDMKNLVLTFCLLAAGAFVQHAAGQVPGGGGPQPGGAGSGGTGVPIDGGASLLLASGAAYGLKRLRQRRARG